MTTSTSPMDIVPAEHDDNIAAVDVPIAELHVATTPAGYVESSTGPTGISASSSQASSDDLAEDDEEEVVDTHTDLLEFPPAPFRRKASRMGGTIGGNSGEGGGGEAGDHPDGSSAGDAGARDAPVQRSLKGLRSRSGDGMTDFRSRPSSFHRGGSRLTRTPSSSSSRRGARRVGPGRSFSTDGVGLSAMRNTRMYQQQQQALLRTTHPGLEKDRDFVRNVIMRTKSDDLSIGTANSSMDGESCDLESCFTTDSISLRKSQLIADPILEAIAVNGGGTGGGAPYDHSYTEDCSYAEHDSVWDSMSQYSRESQFLRNGQILEVLPNGQAVKPPGFIHMGGVGLGNIHGLLGRRPATTPGEDGPLPAGSAAGTVDSIHLQQLSLQNSTNAAVTKEVGADENADDSYSSLGSDVGADDGVGFGDDDDDDSIRDTTGAAVVPNAEINRASTTSRRDDTTTEHTETEFDHTEETDEHLDVTEEGDELVSDDDD